jgi:hypothetical protein
MGLTIIFDIGFFGHPEVAVVSVCFVKLLFTNKPFSILFENIIYISGTLLYLVVMIFVKILIFFLGLLVGTISIYFNSL